MKLVIGAIALATLMLVDLVLLFQHPALSIVPLALLGWYLADFASGAVHMYMDYRHSRAGVGLDALYFYEGSRESDEYVALRSAAFGKLGPIERLTYDFKNHHPRPDALGRRSMAVQVGATLLGLTLPFALLANAAILLSAAPLVLLALLVPFTVGATFAQYFHGTLHRDDSPRIVRAMRRVGLLMRPQDHQHHHELLTRDFSTINGWSNPVLNLVFRTLRHRGYMHESGLTPRS